MLAISSQDYFAPIKVKTKDGLIMWRINYKHAESFQVAGNFVYTILDIPVDEVETSERERLSFIYDGASVKPHPRTLRIFGSEKCGRFTRVLANNQEAFATFQWTEQYGYTYVSTETRQG